MGMISQNPANLTRTRNYATATAALARDIDFHRQRLRAYHRAREANFIRDNQAELEAGERRLDTIHEDEQRRLNIQFELSLEPTQQCGHNAIQNGPREGVGTMPRNLGLTPADQRRTSSWALPPVYTSEYPGSANSILPTLSASESHARSEQMPIMAGDLHDHVLSVQPTPMDAYHIHHEAILDVNASQPLSATDISESLIGLAPVNIPGPNADHGLEAEHVTVLPIDYAGNGPNPQLFSLSDLGQGTPCGYCEIICLKGQDVCSSCASRLGSAPPF